tara:strand:- start:965 stop:1678 length:714 start_codon:yes stop_codon:yes gene_type:complete
MIACIVLFGGRGNRFKHSEPKQYYKIDGKSLLMHCLDSIKTIESLSQLIIVREPIESVRVENMVAEMESFDSQLEVKFCDSGPMRSDSVLNGLKACIPSTKWVLIHDGARAFCPPILLRSLCDHLLKYKAGVVPALPITDTVVELNAENTNTIAQSLSREKLSRVQTPQAFSYSLILNAYLEGKENSFEGTDCSSYALKYGHEVRVIPGSEDNIKVTTPIDVEIAKHILKRRNVLKC